MSRHIEHNSTFSNAAKTVYAAFIDAGYLRDKLAALGGPGAQLLAIEHTADGASYHTQHSIDSRSLPSAVRAVLNRDFTIDRKEVWRAGGDGFSGTVSVTIAGMPGQLDGTLALADDADGSRYAIRGEISVPIPLVGGKIEESVGTQITRLLAAETQFTEKWLADHAD
ncbi:MAG: DUF2505 domain-containing protein [Sciscionella sp.]|nr:DUF2505 domain-containing protein [Sciscionella sp.]